MAITKTKGDIGEAMVLADVLRRGYKAAIPLGEDWKYDLIVLRKNKLLRLQCKYSQMQSGIIFVRCRSANNWKAYSYTKDDFDWLAVYEPTLDKCYYLPSHMGDQVFI